MRYRKEKGSKLRLVFIALLVLVLAGTLVACTANGGLIGPTPAPSPSPTPMNVFPEGTSLGGKDVSGKTKEEGVKLAQAAMESAVKAIEISVKFQDDTVLLSGADFNTQDTVETSVTKLFEDKTPGAHDLSFVVDLSPQGKQKLEAAATACTVEAKNATVAGFDGSVFTFTDEVKGQRVDMETTLASIKQLLSQKHGGAIQATLTQTDPTVTKQYLTDNFKQLGVYTTESSNTENGNSNMALAMSHVNGTVLEPGQTFSYNDIIGDSTTDANGYLPAGGISGGIMVQVYGGGICQGSSTLYGAILRAGMEIVWRDCHAFPSTYCPIGLDATVDYGNIDFQFKNPMDTPVYLAGWMDGLTVGAAIYGCPSPDWDYIDVGSQQDAWEDALTTTSFVTDYNLEPGQYVRRSSGSSGSGASAWRSYYKNEALQWTETLPYSYYAPTGIIYAVGPSTNTDAIDTTSESGNAGTV